MTMRPFLTLAVILAFPPAVFAADAASSVQADWRRDGIDARVKAALTEQGWRLEDDGRVLDPKSKLPVTKAVLDKAALDLRQGARRAALEAVNLMLASGKPLEPADRGRIQALSPDLPPALAAALLDPRSDIRAVKSLADSDLARVTAYFDGGRTMAERQAAARPIFAGTPRPRVELPYYTALERSLGEKIRAAAETEIGRDPFGKTVLARLKGKNGKPDLPPIVIEDQNSGAVARYDFRRRAVVLDRELVLASVIGAAPPLQASALRASLSARGALTAYLESHPEAVDAVVKDNDVVLVHELTHAWQDSRDPIFREMARGNLPDAQPLEYEEEAYKTKNLYIHSKLKNDPTSVKMDHELADFTEMLLGLDSWRHALFSRLINSSPSRALPLKSIKDVQAARAANARRMSASTSAERQGKALDLLAMGRSQQELAALETAHRIRMAQVDAEFRRAEAGRFKLLGGFYLAQALQAKRAPDRIVLLDQAERYAIASRNAILLAEVRKAKGMK